MANDNWGTIIGVGVAGFAAWWLYNNWVSVSSSVTSALSAGLLPSSTPASSVVPNPAANSIVLSSIPPPVQSSLVQVPTAQTPAAPATPPATPVSSPGPVVSSNQQPAPALMSGSPYASAIAAQNGNACPWINEGLTCAPADGATCPPKYTLIPAGIGVSQPYCENSDTLRQVMLGTPQGAWLGISGINRRHYRRVA